MHHSFEIFIELSFPLDYLIIISLFNYYFFLNNLIIISFRLFPKIVSGQERAHYKNLFNNVSFQIIAQWYVHDNFF